MTDKELIQAIGQIVEEKLEPVNNRLNSIEEKLEALEEGQEEIRSSVNALLEWSDKVSDTIKFPLPRIE